jgi:hypothetical protein
MSQFKAKIILDSINPHNGIRLVTSELTYPRFIHAEFMTHRMFSRNAASSRAIPSKKMIGMVEESPAMPVYWGKNKRGMSAKEELVEPHLTMAKNHWLGARSVMVGYAKDLCFNMKLHKQITNRILEPWKYITVICTATNHSNFFALRDHEDAQPEIAHLARLWKVAQDESEPVERIWHIPYIQDDEQDLDLELRRKIGVARCARVSVEVATDTGARLNMSLRRQMKWRCVGIFTMALRDLRPFGVEISRAGFSLEKCSEVSVNEKSERILGQ